jgi:hypothetical protein
MLDAEDFQCVGVEARRTEHGYYSAHRSTRKQVDLDVKLFQRPQHAYVRIRKDSA